MLDSTPRRENLRNSDTSSLNSSEDRLPRVETTPLFGRYDKYLSVRASRILRKPYVAEVDYNAFTTPLQSETLRRITAELATVRTRLCRTDSYVLKFNPNSVRGEIHGALTVPACMQAAAILEPSVLNRGVMVSHQISKPFSCELDLYVHTGRLPRTSFPNKERLLYAHFKVDGQSVFVKGYPTDQAIVRAAIIHEHCRFNTNRLRVLKADTEVAKFSINLTPLPQSIASEVLSEPRMQAFLMSDLAVYSAQELCQRGHFSDDALAGYVARTENFSMRSLAPLFSRDNEVQVTITHKEKIESLNAIVAPIEIKIFGSDGESGKLKMYFAWDKPGELVLWKTHIRA